MKPIVALRASACFAALLAGTAASADVTAADVWANWKENIAAYGQNGVTIGAESESGGTITISDLSLNIDDGNTAITADLGDIVFTENGDGTVAVTMASSYPVVIDDGEGSKISVSISNAGLSLVASGTPDALSYAISADQYVISVDEIDAEGTVVPADIRITANGLSGNYTITSGAMRDISYALATSSLDFLVDVTDPASDGKVLFSGKMAGVSGSALLSLPEGVTFDDPEALIAGAFSMEGGYSMEGADYIFDIDTPDGQAAGSLSMGAGDINALFNQDQISVSEVLSGLTLAMTSAEFPFPINFSLGEYGVGFNMPVSATDTPQPFNLNFNLADLAVNDEIWMMGDPSGQLPHDPITVSLDLAGQARWFFDLMDPANANRLDGAEIPGELTSLSLNDLTLRAVGAAVTGNGSFTFDNSDMATFDGFPRPMGSVTINVDGANQLIDTLVAMGLVPQDQAGMGRMMLGMFARSVGDDQLTSTLEVNDQGQVLANGQRVR